MGYLNKTISVKELSEIITSIHIRTLEMYLENFRFNKYRVLPMSNGIHSRFFITKDFLEEFYTTLWMRNRVKAAEKLKKHFEEYDVEAIDYENFVREEFICEKEH